MKNLDKSNTVPMLVRWPPSHKLNGMGRILLKNSSHPEDLAAALPIVSRITPDGYGVKAQELKQLILFTMMKKTMNGTCSKLKIEIIPKTHRVVRLEIIQQ